MSASTADCKEFLAAQLNLDPKGFKRLRKFKDGDLIVREFSHPSSTESIFLFEDNGQLALTTPTAPSSQKSLASKYVFTLVDEDNLEFPETTVLITRRSYFEKTGYQNDQPDYKPLEFLPEEWNADDINECGTWVIETDLSADEIIAKLHDLGCHSDAKFDQLCNGRSALNCPLIESRKIKGVLTETLAQNNPPSKGVSKI